MELDVRAVDVTVGGAPQVIAFLVERQCWRWSVEEIVWSGEVLSDGLDAEGAASEIRTALDRRI